MKFRATPEDLAKGQLVSPGWAPTELISAEDTTDKNGAGLCVVRGRIIGGKEEDKGAILRTNFSEKAPGFLKNFVEALAPGTKFEANKDYDITTANVRGKKMEWYIERGSYNGRPTNNVVDYRPLQV
jgi:hypothetical protein